MENFNEDKTTSASKREQTPEELVPAELERAHNMNTEGE